MGKWVKPGTRGKHDWLFRRPHHAKVWGTKWKKVCPISPLSSPHKKSLQHKTFPISRKKNPEKGASHPTRPDLGVGKGQTKMQCYSFSFVGGKCSVILFQRLLLLLQSIKEALSTVISLSFFSRSFKLPPYSTPNGRRGIYEKAPSENHRLNWIFQFLEEHNAD